MVGALASRSSGPGLTTAWGHCVVLLGTILRAVISSRQPAIIAGYSDENRWLLHSRNDTESIATEQV